MENPVIEVHALVKHYGDVVAVDGVSFRVKSGECVGILGPNGAGKTTTLEILEGLQDPTGGHVRLLGLEWRTSRPELRRRVGVQLQETELFPRATAREIVTLFRSFYPSGVDVDEVLASVGLQEKQNALVRELSGGQRQRLSLATALVARPEILFLDEPTTGLDPHSRRQLWEVVRSLKRVGCTILMTTHYMEEAEQLCDRILIVDRGRIVEEGTAAALIQSLGAGNVIEFSTARPLDGTVLRDLSAGVEPRHEGQVVQLSVKDLHHAMPALLSAVSAAGAELLHLSVRRPTLDDVFLSRTGRHLRGDET